ncbi:hypothetical protein CCB80_10215 [Armatimonadetes bacterium Uphvl-Ar1]|nr:hypothetical protein CCB80_10215 [Armatimonadetes bacterium Uphvl-Ar1]
MRHDDRTNSNYNTVILLICAWVLILGIGSAQLMHLNNLVLESNARHSFFFPATSVFYIIPIYIGISLIETNRKIIGIATIFAPFAIFYFYVVRLTIAGV